MSAPPPSADPEARSTQGSPGRAAQKLPRPAQVCRALLAAMAAADGRRRSRKRDQTPDAIGLDVKRRLLERVVDADPDAADFEAWLMHCSLDGGEHLAQGATWAMGRAVLDEWRMAITMADFASWLECGAPSEDARAPDAWAEQRRTATPGPEGRSG